MIPTMIVFGLVAGRWWKTSLVVGTIGWPLLLFVQDILHVPREVLGAAATRSLASRFINWLSA